MPRYKFLSGFSLKLIAIAAMTVDHIGMLFFPGLPILRVIGRLTFPIMGFFITEGYRHTSNLKRYAGRLLIFGVISILPCLLAFGWGLNIFFTLLCGLLALEAAHRFPSRHIHLPLVLLISLISAPCDWGIGGVWLIYLMGTAKRQKLGIALGVVVGLFLSPLQDWFLAMFYYHSAFHIQAHYFRAGILLAIPLLLCYNGKRGLRCKYLFYWYYPVHLLILAAVTALI